MHKTELTVFQTNPLKLQCPADNTSPAVKTPQPFKITLCGEFCQSLALSSALALVAAAALFAVPLQDGHHREKSAPIRFDPGTRSLVRRSIPP